MSFSQETNIEYDDDFKSITKDIINSLNSSFDEKTFQAKNFYKMLDNLNTDFIKNSGEIKVEKACSGSDIDSDDSGEYENESESDNSYYHGSDSDYESNEDKDIKLYAKKISF